MVLLLLTQHERGVFIRRSWGVRNDRSSGFLCSSHPTLRKVSNSYQHSHRNRLGTISAGLWIRTNPKRTSSDRIANTNGKNPSSNDLVRVLCQNERTSKDQFMLDEEDKKKQENKKAKKTQEKNLRAKRTRKETLKREERRNRKPKRKTHQERLTHPHRLMTVVPVTMVNLGVLMTRRRILMRLLQNWDTTQTSTSGT